jgi:UDP-N-acetylmuramate: L-alanyl-gamma-D-glutamyl-meso-diaminopimelate ligase
VHYRPQTLVINNIEYDHADIFRDLADIRWQFHQLLRTLPGTGRILAQAGDPEIAATLALGCWTPVEYFGDGAKWSGKPLVPDCGRFEVHLDGRCLGQVEWPLLGRHNMHNALAALAAAAHAGANPATLLPALGEFRGVRRRLQRLAEIRQITVYDDFAHHPTAIRLTLESLRHRVGQRRILAILEPRSNTMRMGVHRAELAPALATADLIWLYQPPGIDWDLAEATQSLDGRRRVANAVSMIIEEVAAVARPGDQIVIMSNGGFEDIQRRLIARLEAG